MSKIVIAQINTFSGDISGNSQKIIEYINRAKKDNADLIIFPEYALTGFPFGDILDRHKSLAEKQLTEIENIAKTAENITALVGFYYENVSSVAFIQNGIIRKIIKKNDKDASLEINNQKYTIIIGDNYNNIEKVESDNQNTIINFLCSPSRFEKEYKIAQIFTSVAKKYHVNYIYINKVGYTDNFCFDGASRMYNKEGTLVARAKSFSEDYLVIENNEGKIASLPVGSDAEPNVFDLNYTNDLDRTYKSIVYSIKEYFGKNGFSKAVLGLSGGLDSSVSAVLLADALGKENVWGISMPSKITSSESKNDAKELAQNLGINFFEIPLAEVLDTMKNKLNYAFENVKTESFEKSTTIENLQARTRATILWSISNEYKGMLPIATSDKSEAYIGYATVNGDMSGGFAPIADVTKTKLFALADFLNKTREQKNAIPKSVLEKPPGAELKINPKTGKTVCAEEDNMPYEFLDEIIWYVENKGYCFDDLINHKFSYEKKHELTKVQKEEWINKFFWKSKCAVYKWHIMPASVIIDAHSINSVEYHHPILSKVR